ncbi:hypothetical protein [Phenylobacterium sp.]|uniref:hypothetical protein n=1 Tax=Phenylobacterium sp. TaxID=1871053 RepID=UPI0035B0F881
MSVAEFGDHPRIRAAPPPPGMQTRTPEASAWENFMRSPHTVIRAPGRPPIRLATDNVRAKPAVTPQVSMMIGMTALGLGVWGALFPKSVKRAFGIKAPTAAVVGLFGARELWSGFSLAGDPTRTDVLWARVGADVFDIAVLSALNTPDNPKRGNARLALGAVLAITALDAVTAVRMSAVQRNCV